MVSSVGSGSLTVEVVMAVSVQSRASCSGILVNSDFTSKDTSHTHKRPSRSSSPPADDWSERG